MENRELRTVAFHGDEIVTFESAGTRYVAMRRIVENMGLSWGSQHGKLLEQSDKFACTDIGMHDTTGRVQQMLAMPVEKLPLWLASINPNKIKTQAIRTKVERYQAESAIALHDYWTKGVAVRGDHDGIITGLDPRVMSAIGGMVKGIINKALSETVPALVDKAISDTQSVVVHGVTAGDIIGMAGVRERKGLRGLARFVSDRVRNFCARKGATVRLGQLGPTTAYVFDPKIVREWLSEGGKTEIEKRVAERRGQGVFKLVPKKDAPPDKTG